MRASLTRLLVGLLLLLMPVAVQALGFGALALSSHLKQPLQADVPLLLDASDDVESVHVALADRHEYRQLGLQWQPVLAQLKVVLQQRRSAHPVIALRSVGVIDTPLLSILLKADKAGRGTYYKHYRLLLDPVEAVSLQPNRPLVLPLRNIGNGKSGASAAAGEQEWARIRRYGPVQAGDSLSEIAYRLRRDKRFSNNQVMLALYETNPDGFVGGDINQLKQGAFLNVPRGEVVKTYAGKGAMRKLSQLLTRTHAASPQSVARAQSADREDRKPPAAPAIVEAKSGLRYSGQISISGATADRLSRDLNSVKNGFDQQFAAVHAELMAGKLQMADLGKSVSSLNLSVREIKQDIRTLKQDVAVIKQHTAQAAPAASPTYWQLALAALLASLLGALLATWVRNRRDETPAQPVALTPSSEHPERRAAVAESEAGRAAVGEQEPAQAATRPIADEVVQLLNHAEESLGRCEFEQAEELLGRIDQLKPGSVRAAALKAQLYHETNRHQERNALINSISEAADKQRWERFCQLLPAHVWNACFSADPAGVQHSE